MARTLRRYNPKTLRRINMIDKVKFRERFDRIDWGRKVDCPACAGKDRYCRTCHGSGWVREAESV